MGCIICLKYIILFCTEEMKTYLGKKMNEAVYQSLIGKPLAGVRFRGWGWGWGVTVN